MSSKRCHLLFVYFLLYKELRYILTSAVLEQVAKNRAPVLKENSRNENNQQLSRRESISAAACFARFLVNRVIIFCKSDFKMQTHAHYLRDGIVLQLCSCVLLWVLYSVLISLNNWQNGSKIHYLK